MLELPVLICKKEVGRVFSLGTKYEVQAYFDVDGDKEVLVVDDIDNHHYLTEDWLSEHFDLEGDLELMLEVM